MAIVVPLLIGSTGIGASLAAGASALLGTAVSASALATVAGIAFQVTGINDKINKAASKVFGEDLVNVANIFGTVYSAATGSWDISDEVNGVFGAGGDATSIRVPSDLDKLPTLTSEAWDAAGAANMDAATSAAADWAAANPSEAAALNSFGPAAPKAPAVTDVNGFDLNTGSTKSPTSVGPDTKTAAFGESAQTTQTTATQQQGATAPAATQQQQVPNALKAPGAPDAPKAPNALDAPKVPTKPSEGSFFDKLLNSKAMTPQLMSGVIGGLANGYSTGQAAKMSERQFNIQLERLKNRPRTTYSIGSQAE